MSSQTKSNMASKIALPFLMLIGILCVFIFRLGFLFILISLLPSMVAYFIDNDEHLSTFKTVLAANSAALLVVIYPMISDSMQFKAIEPLGIMRDPFNWLIVFSGAALGWCLIFLCQYATRFFLVISDEYKLRQIEAQQKVLLAEWGDDIKRSLKDDDDDDEDEEKKQSAKS
jgi:magnesium-transporting ATPase (P-type)